LFNSIHYISVFYNSIAVNNIYSKEYKQQEELHRF